MKFKIQILSLGAMLVGSLSSDAATMYINNVSNGPGDTLWSLSDNTPMVAGIVVMGYFPASVLLTDIDTISELVSKLDVFVSVSTIDIASVDNDLSTTVAFPGYAQAADANGISVVGSPINNPNVLLGRSVYQIITNAATLLAATTTNQFGLQFIDTFKGDETGAQPFNGLPTNATTIISGGSGTFVVNDGTFFDNGTYNTFQLAAVPEPSAAIMCMVGTIVLLRHRRK